jgi:hypothetical protein
LLSALYASITEWNAEVLVFSQCAEPSEGGGIKRYVRALHHVGTGPAV